MAVGLAKSRGINPPKNKPLYYGPHAFYHMIWGPIKQAYTQRSSQSVCMFDKFHLTVNFKSKVSRDVFKNKNECQLTSTFPSKRILQCHMPSSMRRFKSLKCQLMCGFFLDKSHYMSKPKLCMSIDMYFYFCASFSILAKTLSNIYTSHNLKN